MDEGLPSGEGRSKFDPDKFFKSLTTIEVSHMNESGQLDPLYAIEHFKNKLNQITYKLDQLRELDLLNESLLILVNQMPEENKATCEGEIRGLEGRFFTKEEIDRAFPQRKKQQKS